MNEHTRNAHLYYNMNTDCLNGLFLYVINSSFKRDPLRDKHQCVI